MVSSLTGKAHPISAIGKLSPAIWPNNGGKIKLPAPKKRENKARPNAVMSE